MLQSFISVCVSSSRNSSFCFMEAENLLSHVPICSFFCTKILLYKHILSWLLQLNISFSFLQTKDKMFYYVCKIHAVSCLIRIYWTREATGHVGCIRCTITLLRKHKEQIPDCYPYPLSPILLRPVARGLTNLPPNLLLPLPHYHCLSVRLCLPSPLQRVLKPHHLFLILIITTHTNTHPSPPPTMTQFERG